MLDRHAVQALVRAKVTAREIAEQLKVSRPHRAADCARGGGDDRTTMRRRGRARQVGRPQVTEAVRARVHALVLEDPDRPPGEICRLLKAEGTPLGLSTVYRVLTAVRATIPDGAPSALRRRRRRVRAV